MDAFDTRTVTSVHKEASHFFRDMQYVVFEPTRILVDLEHLQFRDTLQEERNSQEQCVVLSARALNCSELLGSVTGSSFGLSRPVTRVRYPNRTGKIPLMAFALKRRKLRYNGSSWME